MRVALPCSGGPKDLPTAKQWANKLFFPLIPGYSNNANHNRKGIQVTSEEQYNHFRCTLSSTQEHFVQIRQSFFF